MTKFKMKIYLGIIFQNPPKIWGKKSKKIKNNLREKITLIII